ncbi:hypothetical protein [Streptomyces ipomoeae]|uniref:hypothetical protein n=1 Tax=Streptomyces ipomoeae TaxID=103232 RepID=UPI0011465999|nr:hypothetical protein [Streptomyces ipomoeae]TQE35450.1 hypothetical protein Sipo7851_14405 [Streptomyces ipomoeae]
MSESAQIAAFLIGLAVLTPVLVTLRHTGRSRYPADASYATFHDGRPAVLLDCEGLCEGPTEHEHAGDGTATCITCGTPRPAYVPDEV